MDMENFFGVMEQYTMVNFMIIRSMDKGYKKKIMQLSLFCMSFTRSLKYKKNYHYI